MHQNRIFSYHSLGRVSIYKASQANKEEDYKKELEKAIEFFEKAVHQSSEKWSNPSEFCLPFYRSFHTIIFQKKEAKEEVNKYLEEAKAAIEGSESKKQLYEAVTNLADALKEVQNLEKIDLETKKGELNFYRKYCDHAAKLMRDTDEKAPYATGVLRKGLPLLDRNLKMLLEEIQEKAKAVCKQTKGTPAESLGFETKNTAEELSDFSDYSALDTVLNEQIEDFKKYCGFILPGKKSQFLTIIEETKTMDIHKKLKGITRINDYILENALFPRIEYIHIAERSKENVRIATAQFNYTLSEKFPYRIKEDDKEEMKEKIINILTKAQKEMVDILCLPELCNCEDWLPEIMNQCQRMILIPGTYYDKEKHNVCKLITNIDMDIQPQLKIIPSDLERPDLIGQGMVSGEKVLNVYESQFGKFAVLICRDFGNFSSHLKGIADIIFCPSYNEANDRFHIIAHSHVTDSPSYIVISNAAQHGGTSIFGRMSKHLFGILQQNNCKEKGDTSYKLCQIEKGKEGMIIVDFNLSHKYLPQQSSMDLDEMPVKNIKKLIF